MRFATLIASAVAGIGLTTIAHAGMLVNESFESNTLGVTYGWSDSSIPGWQFQAGTSGYGQASVESAAIGGKDGNNYLVAQFDAVQTKASDRPAVSPGQTLTLNLLFRHTGNNWTDTKVYLDYYASQSGYTPLSSSGSLNLPNAFWGGYSTMDSFAPFSTTAVVPTGANYVGVRFVTPDIWQNAVQFDNVQLTVPEPASLGLLAGSGLLLVRRRRD